MQRIFITAAFFWACTFTQQAQFPSSDSKGIIKRDLSLALLAAEYKGDSLSANFPIRTYDSVLAMGIDNAECFDFHTFM